MWPAGLLLLYSLPFVIFSTLWWAAPSWNVSQSKLFPQVIFGQDFFVKTRRKIIKTNKETKKIVLEMVLLMWLNLATWFSDLWKLFSCGVKKPWNRLHGSTAHYLSDQSHHYNKAELVWGSSDGNVEDQNAEENVDSGGLTHEVSQRNRKCSTRARAQGIQFLLWKRL